MALSRVRLLVATLWAGSLWTVGYLVAPTLFATQDSAVAGLIVGSMLRSESWLSIGCALAMLGLLKMAPEIDARRRQGLGWLVLAMLACSLVVSVGLQPIMAALRDAAGPGGLRGSPQALQFGILHGISQLFYVIESLLAGVLVVRNA
jgi:hypothetical protein